MVEVPSTAVILAGGFGTRMSELTNRIPKAMVDVSGAPIVVHIMRHFYRSGVRNFVLATGYLHEVIEDYFRHYSDCGKVVSFSPGGAETVVRGGFHREEWTVTLVNSGLAADTADRVRSVRDFIPADSDVFLTYGDCWGDVDLEGLYAHHVESGCQLTLTAVPIVERFGLLTLKGDGSTVESFTEKASSEDKLVNGGFMVVSPRVFAEIPDADAGDFSRTVLPRLSADGEVSAFRHDGFWKAVDSVRDLRELQVYADSRGDVFYG